MEALNAAQISKVSIDKETASWLGALSPTLYDKLVGVGLAQPRKAPEQLSLGAFLDSYIVGRSDVKSSTSTVYGHTKRCLLEFFSREKPLADISPDECDDFRRYLLRKKESPRKRLARV